MTFFFGGGRHLGGGRKGLESGGALQIVISAAIPALRSKSTD